MHRLLLAARARLPRRGAPWLPVLVVLLAVGACRGEPLGGGAGGNAITWRSRAPMPIPRMDFGVAVVAGRIHAIGGFAGETVNLVEVYDPATDRWTRRAPMPTARQAAVTAVFEDRIFVIGGHRITAPGRVQYANVTEIYDPITDRWSTDPLPPPIPPAVNDVFGNQAVAGGTIADRIYVALYDTQWRLLLVLDPAAGAWSQRDLRMLIEGQPSAAVLDQSLYVLDRTESMMSSGIKFASYAPADGFWRGLPEIPRPSDRRSFRKFGSIVAARGAVYSIGGNLWYQDNDTTERLAAVDRFDPAARAWTRAATLPSPRHSVGLAVVDDRIYVMGGAATDWQPVPTDRVDEGRFAP